MCKYDDPGVSESTTPSFVFVYGSVYMRNDLSYWRIEFVTFAKHAP